MKLAGVCSGLAAYLDGCNLDESNLVWCSILGLFTAGISTSLIIFLYVVFWIILPKQKLQQILK